MYFKDAERDELVVPVYYKLVLGLGAVATILIGVYPGLIMGLI